MPITNLTLTTNKILGNANKANLVYSNDLYKWRYTNDGINYFDIGSGGGGTNSVVVDDYTDLPADAVNGTYGFVRNTLTGVYYICVDNEWRPIYSYGTIGANKADLTIFSNQLEAPGASIVEGAIKLQPEDLSKVCGIYNYTAVGGNQSITTSVNICLPPIVDGDPYEIMAGCFIKSGNKLYTLMVGFNDGYDCAVIKAQNWNSTISLQSQRVVPYPTLGDDFNMLKIDLVNSSYYGFTSGPVQDSGGFSYDIDWNIPWNHFFASKPNQYGFCMYTTIPGASAYFINNYADDGDFFNYTYTGFTEYGPP